MDRHSPRRILALLLALTACRPTPDRGQLAKARLAVESTDSTTTPAQPDSSPSALASTAAGSDTSVRPLAVPAPVKATCDSVASIMRDALGLEVHRQNGSYHDTFDKTARVGCRLTAKGIAKARAPSNGPVTTPLEEGFAKRGWRSDVHFSADGPDGSVMGMRVRDMLCIVTEHGDGGDDDDPLESHQRAAPDPGSKFIIECARDVSSDADAGEPDSESGVASRAGAETFYLLTGRSR